jgi:hypothetical protein
MSHPTCHLELWKQMELGTNVILLTKDCAQQLQVQARRIMVEIALGISDDYIS